METIYVSSYTHWEIIMQIKNKDNEYVDISNTTLVEHIVHNIYVATIKRYHESLDVRNIAPSKLFGEITVTLKGLNALPDVEFKVIYANESGEELRIASLTELDNKIREYINPFRGYVGIAIGTQISIDISLSNNSDDPKTACYLPTQYNATVSEGEDDLHVSELPEDFMVTSDDEKDFVYFIDKTNTHYVSFKIYRVVQWNDVDNEKPEKVELVLGGSMKWDGCFDYHWRCGHACSWGEQVAVHEIIKEIQKVTILHMDNYDDAKAIVTLGLEEEYENKWKDVEK